MPTLYSTLLVCEPDYGERVVRVHGGVHRHGVSQTDAVDLVTGERVRMPISTRWDPDTGRTVPVCADGWSWRPIPLAAAERRARLPKGSLPPPATPPGPTCGPMSGCATRRSSRC